MPVKAETLRGHIGLKSSALAPTSCKFSAQSMVDAHLKAHLHKIVNARSSIDTKQPKSMIDCPIVRDRIRREIMLGLRTESPYDNNNNNHNNKKTYMHNPLSTPSMSSMTNVQNSLKNQDLLKVHTQKFTEEAPFTPRTLKREDIQSKIATMSCYRGRMPPKKKQETRPFSQNSSLKAWTMDESIVSRQDQQKRDASVPPLNISVDADNYQWLKEQSKKAILRQETLLRSKKKQQREIKRNVISDDESKYLDFIQEITTDILDRNIFTDRVLDQVFERHINKWKHQLNLERMQAEIRQLKIDIGITTATNYDKNNSNIYNIENDENKNDNNNRLTKTNQITTRSSINSLPTITDDTTADWTDAVPTPNNRQLQHLSDYEQHLEETESKHLNLLDRLDSDEIN